MHTPMTPVLLAVAAAALAGPALAQQVLPAQSEIAFVSRQMGVPVEGRFKQWTAQIAFDPKNAAAGKVGFTIQTGSASFGAPETDAEVPKHRGMTAFVIDMAAPGVEVRPLRQMTGEAEFNEVYFTDVRVPDAMRVDDVGRGWAVAITTLMNERVSIGGGTPPRNSGAIGQLLSLYRERADASDAVTRDRFMRLWSRAEINRITNLRASQNRRLGTPGPEGSIAKLAMADLNKALTISAAVSGVTGASLLGAGLYLMRRKR